MKRLIIFSLFLSLSSWAHASEWNRFKKAPNLPWYDSDEQSNHQSPVANQPATKQSWADYDDSECQQASPAIPTQTTN